MKVLHTADWHIGQFKGPVEDGVNLRSLDTVKCLEYMVEKAKEEKPDLVCISGDVFHQEQIGPVRYSDEMVTATRIIDELSKVSKFVVVMRGTPNHDGAGQFRVLTKMLEHNKKVAVVTTPQVISTPIADIVCIPGFDKQEFRAKFPGLSAEEENLTWTNHISEMVMGLRAQCSQTNIVADMVPAILMAHYTVPGCNMESGQTSFFSNFEPVIPREALQTAQFDAVLLGHIHRPQMLEGLENVFYSGAINAMNFNDEGQKRGFWIHEFEKKSLKKGHLYETPYRKFQTIKWDKEDVAEYLRSGKMYLLEKDYASSCMDAIVRLQYSCDTEQKKALNIPVLQKDLYEIGAFYVADIEAESMMNITNRQLLSEESDPLLNLKKWLDEKCFTDSEKIVELAEPIIADAMKSSNTVEIHGVFKPVSIKVKNYRTYKEEFFDFDDISFCTINGVNGAGKSSLFMDAISDCLFEETREGDNKSWIRGTEDARNCRFLKKAKEDASKIENTEKCISTIKEAMKEAETAFSEFEQKKQEELQNIGYSKEKETSIRERIAELEVYQAKKQRIEESRLKRARLEAEKESNDKTIASCSENASEVKLQAQEITERVNNLSERVNLYEQVKEKADGLKVYAEQEKSLPVYEERVKNARENMAMQEKQLEKKDEELIVMVADMISASELMESFDSGMESKVSDLEERMETEKKKLQDLQVQKGTLIQKAEDVKSMKEEISELKKDIEACALITTRYDVLKQAFSQDGVPHQIIRNIIPHITDTANNILGQMTGGTMGVDFVMERTVKGKDGDKATLDVLIEEYGKTTLPYASKSGGEKVKASLAVILALSEIKATAAGIQLGMLFIDEPPFLDDDGTQAYVDSLEAIRQRYPDVKVMAITHDDAMKARFNQSVTVIKTEEGSKVIY